MKNPKNQSGLTSAATIELDNLKFKPEALLELVNLVEAKTISSSAAQQVFAEMFETGKFPAAIVQEKGLAQVSDTGAIEKFCDDAIAANPNSVADYKAGKVAALNLLKGQVMKLEQGQSQPKSRRRNFGEEAQNLTTKAQRSGIKKSLCPCVFVV